MRHRRHALIPTHPRALRATAAMPCVAALLVAALTGAAPGSGAHADGGGRGASVSEYGAAGVKSPGGHGTSRTHPSPSATATSGQGVGTGEAALTDPVTEADADADADDLYETDPDPGPLEDDYPPSPGRRATTAATGEVSPVLPLGAGMTLIGLGLALIALRLRRA